MVLPIVFFISAFCWFSVVVNGQCDGTLEKFVDELPIPPTIHLRNGNTTAIYISQFTQKLHRDLPPTKLWGYQGTYPGPTIDTRSNEQITVQWVNKLPSTPLFSVPNATRTIVHLHGGHVPPASDGYPTNHYGPGEARTNVYPNKQDAATLWYHDHTNENTRVNVYIGMAGLYIIRDAQELSLKLPSGKYEIPLVIQDRNFDADGQLSYFSDFPPDPNYVGETILVNGKVWPFINVEPTVYRFRLLNGANNRFFTVSLSNGASFTQIGGDQGFLPKAVSLTSILLSNAERADVLIDFSSMKGQKIVLQNSASAPNYPGGNPPDPCTSANVLQFVVANDVTCDESCPLMNLPAVIKPRPDLRSKKISMVRNLTLDTKFGGFLLDNKMFTDPISERPVIGTTEIWNFISNTFMAHPIHLHLVHFHIVGRQELNRKRFEQTGEIQLGDSIPIPPNEQGPKDTVRVDSQGVTSIQIDFTDYTGLYVWHCHMLEHEDYMMMRPYEVVKAA